MSSDQPGQSEQYRVPALDKALDVLECLAGEHGGLTQAQIARSLGRGSSELFRVLTTLERRGYVVRDGESGAYRLTLRLFELGHSHGPSEELRHAAARPMRTLAEASGHSCHLCVRERGRLLVLAQEESPARVRVSVELGSTLALHLAASGRVLLAAATDRDALLTDTGLDDAGRQPLEQRLRLIADRGYEEARSETTEGVSDLSVPIGAATAVQATVALTGLARDHSAFVVTHLPMLRVCAAEIARACGLTATKE